MSYIKTQNGKIYKVVDNKDYRENFLKVVDEELYNKHYVETEQGYFAPRREIVAEAETIKELCDEFVVKINIHTVVVHDLESALKLVEGHEGSEVFGAIWTEWGLKYVAKMNDEEVLELL